MAVAALLLVVPSNLSFLAPLTDTGTVDGKMQQAWCKDMAVGKQTGGGMAQWLYPWKMALVAVAVLVVVAVAGLPLRSVLLEVIWMLPGQTT